MNRLAEHWEATANELMRRNVVERRERPDVDDIAVQADLLKRQTADVNHRPGFADTNSHPVQELSATR